MGADHLWGDTEKVAQCYITDGFPVKLNWDVMGLNNRSKNEQR